MRPVTNENIYTNLWHGPFYGFERVIETFEMTDAPRRLKAVDIYYHSYSASKQASLKALHKAYQWALRRKLHPVYGSEYIRKVEDFYEFAIGRDARAGACAARAIAHAAPAAGSGHACMAESTGVAGYAPGVDGSYLHLAGGVARMVVRTGPRRPPPPLSGGCQCPPQGLADPGRRQSALHAGRSCAAGAAHVSAAWLLAELCRCQFLHQRGSRCGPLLHPLLQKCQPQCPTPSAMPCALSARPRFLTG
jgi:hypothetical protein